MTLSPSDSLVAVVATLALVGACAGSAVSVPPPVTASPGFAPEPIPVAPIEPVRLSPESVDRRARALSTCDAVQRNLEQRIASAEPLATQLALSALSQLLVAVAGSTPNTTAPVGVPLGTLSRTSGPQSDRRRLRAIRTASHELVIARSDAEIVDASERLLRSCAER